MKKSRLKLKERDYTILKHIYDYRFLSGELLWHLLKSNHQADSIIYSTGNDGRNRPRKYGFKQQSLSKRLKQLYDAKYVERHYMTDQPYGRGYGSPRAIYGLGKHSSKVLEDIFNIPRAKTQKIVSNNKIKSPYLRHALELATFRIILELACQQSTGRVVLLLWEQGLSIKDYVNVIDKSGEQVKFSIYADAFFGIRIRGRKDKHFFLEIDRGTEPIVSTSNRSNIRSKLIGYQHYYKTKKIHQKYDFMVNGFQVLIVTTGKIETDNTFSGRITNILDELVINPNLYSLKSLYLLTIPESFRLDNPTSIFENIWVSSKSQSLLSLID
ncbi:MAG: replication-relaxation family protein [Methanosarcinaceae archaeon]